jgi:hypothetical protein
MVERRRPAQLTGPGPDALPASTFRRVDLHTTRTSRGVRITFDRLGLFHEQIMERALARSNRMRGTTATYGHSGLESNYVGILGELAAATWLSDLGIPVTDTSEDLGADADLQAGTGMIVEAKASRSPWWQNNGARLTAHQTGRILYGDILVWSVTSPRIPTEAVWIMGWAPTWDLGSRLTPVHDPQRGLGFHISHLEDPAELTSWAAGHTSQFAKRLDPNLAFMMITPVSVSTWMCAKGHRSAISSCLSCWWEETTGIESRLYVVDKAVHRRICRQVPNPPPWFTDADALLSARTCEDCTSPDQWPTAPASPTRAPTGPRSTDP